MTKKQRRVNHNRKVAARSATVQQIRTAFMLRYAGLNVLTIEDLRKRSRGIVRGGYNMRKEQLIESLIRAGV